ncbi:MAG: PQQ-binding-like beta-propeller repeat protein [Phycisphaerales bacterium]|jgi:hypothetical protein
MHRTPNRRGSRSTSPRRSAVRSGGPAIRIMQAGLITALFAGLSTGAWARQSGTGSDVADANRERLEQMQQQLDARSLFPPSRLRELGYRADWQTEVPPSPGASLDTLFLRGDALYTRDTNNLLSRVSRDRGEVLWQSPIGSPRDELIDVLRLRRGDEEKAVAIGRLEVFVVDNANGIAERRQEIERTLYTSGAVFGPYFIYGTRDGQIIWHQYEVGYPWRGNSLPGSVSATPLIVDDLVYVVGSTGRILALDAASTRLVWEKQLIAGIDDGPACQDGVLLVAGRDQYLWALDAKTGRTLWRYFTESPLTTSPVADGDSVYQFVPTEGLVKLSLRPEGSIAGDVQWRSTEATGRILGRRGSRLLLWDAPTRTMRTVDVATGDVVEQIELPAVADVVAEGFENPALQFLASNGTVMRIVPQQ